MNAGQLVREARRRRGLDQAQLARRAGTTQTYVSRVERGAVSPSVRTLERLIHACGQRLTSKLEPLPHGNLSKAELRAQMRDLTPAERVEQAMELSSFLTGLAESASGRPEGRHGSR
jgi:transcriptional regulator with XRE-family HTH domain